MTRDDHRKGRRGSRLSGLKQGPGASWLVALTIGHHCAVLAGTSLSVMLSQNLRGTGAQVFDNLPALCLVLDPAFKIVARVP